METINTTLGALHLSQIIPEEGILQLTAELQGDGTLCGFILTETLDYTDDAAKAYDVHRTGIRLHPFFRVDDVPLYSLGFPANLKLELRPLPQTFAKVRVTVKAFLVDVTEDDAFRYVAGFSFGYEKEKAWAPLPITKLHLSDWEEALARLNYESPSFRYRLT